MVQMIILLSPGHVPGDSWPVLQKGKQPIVFCQSGKSKANRGSSASV